MSKSKLMADPRYVAVHWLTQVVQHGVSVNQLMAKPIEHLEPQDRGLAKQLLFGSLRFFHQLTTLGVKYAQ